jgi:hypothetical protein
LISRKIAWNNSFSTATSSRGDLAPRGEGEASAWLQRRAQIGKSAGRLREKRDAKARKKEIESGRFEPVGRRVGVYEFDRAPGGSRSAARASIGTETSTPSTCPEGPTCSASASRRYRSRYRQHVRPGVAALAPALLAGSDPERRLRLLAFDPTAAASAIPVGDFSFILWVVLVLGL